MIVTEVKHQALTKRHVDECRGTQVWLKPHIFSARKIINKRKVFAYTFTERNIDVPVQRRGGNHSVTCHICVKKIILFSKKQT